MWVVQILDLCYYGNLNDLISQSPKKKLHWTVARHIAGQIVSFLERAHVVEGVIHSRINPKNVLFGKSLLVKITDFGSAKFLNQKDNVYDWIKNLDIDNEEHLPELKDGLNYLAPEFIEEGLVGKANDFWSLGCIIFYMLTGKDPFPITSR